MPNTCGPDCAPSRSSRCRRCRSRRPGSIAGPRAAHRDAKQALAVCRVALAGGACPPMSYRRNHGRTPDVRTAGRRQPSGRIMTGSLSGDGRLSRHWFLFFRRDTDRMVADLSNPMASALGSSGAMIAGILRFGFSACKALDLLPPSLIGIGCCSSRQAEFPERNRDPLRRRGAPNRARCAGRLAGQWRAMANEARALLGTSPGSRVRCRTDSGTTDRNVSRFITQQASV